MVASARRRKAARAASRSSRSPISPARSRCFVPRGSQSDGKFNPDDWMEPKEQRKVDDFIIYAMAAAEQALDGCRLEVADTPEKQERTGVLIGSGIGGLPRHRRDRRCC